MRIQFDLTDLDWTLTGWTPYIWRQQRSIESGVSLNAEVPGVPVRVPGSVQGALRDAGVLPDWNVALDARNCEWVENRHWIYSAHLPDDWLTSGANVRLCAAGLDYKGWLLVNGNEVAPFIGSLVPHEFVLTPHLRERNNSIQIVLDCPPRWLGQIGYTPEMREWKPRFNYFWDWTSRLVQLGIWDDLSLEITDGDELGALHCTTGAHPDHDLGTLRVWGTPVAPANAHIVLALTQGERLIRSDEVPAVGFAEGLTWEDLQIERWYPNGSGNQPLYDLRCTLVSADGSAIDRRTLRVGFKSVSWAPCDGAPAHADPWICVANGTPVFLQGVNWTPIRPNFADVTPEMYRRILQTYRDLGCNLLRVWGGAILEKRVFYDLCDEFGLFVWQEFPLSSSGLDNRPPEDAQAIEQMARVAESYIQRRRHHVSLLLWCGGNELQDSHQKPATGDHPMIARMAHIARQEDPERRFLSTSPSGPGFSVEEQNVGTGVHWDVHGPWQVTGDLDAEWTRYWANDDALFRSEVGVSSASPVEIIRRYRGNLPEVPGTRENPLWRRNSWWIDWPAFVEERGREPQYLEEFVDWSQERQARALSIALCACKGRFPRCGGFLIWMGHDSFPCTANLAIIDFDGNPKPAAEAVGRLFRG